MSGPVEVLTVEETYRADQAAIQAGVQGFQLMENAGRAVAEALDKRMERGCVAVLCGPGNNGGDGWVAARHLQRKGWQVRLASMVDREKLKGDAAHHARQWHGTVEELSPAALDGADAVIDALFGAGLSRGLHGAVRDVVQAVRRRRVPVFAVDVPSGVKGDDGQTLGDVAVEARATVTFFRKKPGHLLMPGRKLCGEVILADIGIPQNVLHDIVPATFENVAALWRARWPWRRPDTHKYDYGHAVVFGGVEATGAGRLACRAALRGGAGLVSVAVPSAVLPVYATGMPSLITMALDGEEAFGELISDTRKNAFLIGPGAGVTATTRWRAESLLDTGRAVVLDADALTVFRDEPAALAAAIRGPTVLTPHEGEFRRIFPDLRGDKLTRARKAAYATGAVVLLKGYDTVIAAPDGRAAINTNAPAELATAGAGDVLAGILLGCLAQGMAPFDAACAAAWLHGQSAQGFGPGLIAEDLPDRLPTALRQIEVQS
ncbi:NAD(P)H-hydrate dehydratase [Ferruginivarius sediminum]|uniref:Bifunctional NAD(P)H-hydrate repair enzyme n=1 Tax=Ferruginivarius sediminum TaxID=2661937 RepID=A0A369TH25_9PROT|nr:NAD(P)H-hydrate dehydratase [Ferruginivarius sediminum]RDD63924.1 NAD(P)H-hydrate dehydratase [Ferruginivarius sediminum]